MADRNKLKIADQDNVDQDDPFAELTKIMGFDPRVPMKRSEAEALQKLSAPAPVVDDFDIDLERELLGEFALDDEEEKAPAIQAVVPRVVSPAPVASPTTEVPEKVETESEEPLAQAADDGIEDAAEVTDAAEFDAADFDLAFDDEFEAPAGQDAVAALDDMAEAEDAAAAGLADHEADFDTAFARSMDEELDGDWKSEAAETEARGAEPVHAAAPRSDLDSAFDAAMAEVDMDFSAVERPQRNAAAHEPAEIADEDLATEEDGADERPVFAADEDGLAASASTDSRDLPEQVETSLEDELEVLVGNSSRAQPIAADEIVETASDEAAFDDFDWELETAVEEEEPVAEQPAPVAAADERDEFEEAQRVANEDRAEENYAAAVETDDLDWQMDPSPVADAGRDAADDEPGFDDEAFAATFADGMDDLLPEQDGTRFEDEEPEIEAVAGQEPERAKVAEPDPFEALRRMAGSWRSLQQTNLAAAEAPRAAVAPVVAYEPEPVYEAEDEPEEALAHAPAYDDVPEIETVDVPESAIALADDLDLPELAFEEDAPPPAYDDLDAEFASLLSEMNSPEPAPASQPATRDAWLDRSRERAPAVGSYAYPAAAASAIGAAAYASAAPAQSAQRTEEIDLGELDLNFDEQAFDAAMAGTYDQYDQDEQEALPPIPDYDPDLDDEMSIPGVPPVAEAPSRRGFWIAALVGGVAVAGGVGAFALSFGDGAGIGTPALVKADTSPIKVRPENPGGTVVPNQDNKVYETVAKGTVPAAGANQPKQEKLVTTTEEPMDVAAAETDAPEPPVGFSAEEEGATPPMAKGEDRIEQVIGEAEAAAGAEEVPAVQPRKVRTMVVKPDGSLVPADMPTPEPATGTGLGADAAPLEPAKPTAKPAREAIANAPEATGTVAPVEAAPAAAAPAEAAPVAEVPAKPKGKTKSSTTPNQVAIAPARPADQPLDIVGEVKPDQVAAIDTQPTATAVASGAWSMQIASQPSQEAAQSTYQDLARRYGGVLSGRSVNIVKAEIAGKGTFWRVRVPAQSRNDAVNLCNNYKAAGGNCFVSK